MIAISLKQLMEQLVDNESLKQFCSCISLALSNLFERFDNVQDNLVLTGDKIHDAVLLFKLFDDEAFRPPEDFVWRYGDGTLYGTGQYGLQYNRFVAYPKPDGLESISVLIDHLTQPSIILHKDLDYTFDDSNIIFKQNLELPRSTENGRSYIKLWGLNVENLASRSNLPVKARKIVSQAKFGTPNVLALLEELLNAPYAHQSGQIEVQIEPDYKYIALNDQAKVLKPTTVLLVADKDKVNKGQLLTENYKILNKLDSLPADIPFLVFSHHLINTPFSSLIFPNKTEHLRYSEDGKPRFTVYGNENDVKKFWEKIDKALEGQTLPDQINPAQLLFDMLKDKVLFLQVDIPNIEKKENIQKLDVLREFLPANHSYMVILQMDVGPSTKTASLDDSATLIPSAYISDTKLGSLDSIIRLFIGG